MVPYWPYGPWPHVPEVLWTNNPLVVPPEEGDDESILTAYHLCGKPGIRKMWLLRFAFL